MTFNAWQKKEINGNNMTFETWMNVVDTYCYDRFSLSIHDLPDMCFRDAYDDGVSPSDFVDEIDESDLF